MPSGGSWHQSADGAGGWGGRHNVVVSARYNGQPLGRVAVVLAVFLVALGHVLFGLANFQPGFPKLEGIAALTAGAMLLASLVVARWSVYGALLTACFGTTPLSVWFAYAVPIERSSSPGFFLGFTCHSYRYRHDSTGVAAQT